MAGVLVVGALAYGTVSSGGGSSTKVADPGGGSVPAAQGAEAPYAITTLPPIGNAAQDPGGGGGGGNTYSNVGPPGIQGPQGAGGPPAPGGATSDRLYFSGVNLLDPNQSAATSGDNTFPQTATALTGALGPALGPSATGCAQGATEVDYYAIPLVVETVGFDGTPLVHMRISGNGPLQATLYEQEPNNGACQAITSGSGFASGGIANISLGARKIQFRKGYTPSLVINSVNGATHTISTAPDNPSYLKLPGLFGV